MGLSWLRSAAVSQQMANTIVLGEQVTQQRPYSLPNQHSSLIKKGINISADKRNKSRFENGISALGLTIHVVIDVHALVDVNGF